MYLTKEPAAIESVVFEENTLKIRCACRTFDHGITSSQKRQIPVPGKMTIELFSPVNKVISVRIKNHSVTPRAKRSTLYDLRPSAAGEVVQTENEIIFKSGELEARISKTGNFHIRFFCNGGLLTYSNPDEGICYKTDAGAGSDYRVDTSSSMVSASMMMFHNEKIFGLGGAASSIARNGSSVRTNRCGRLNGTEAIPFYISTSGYGLLVNAAGSTGIKIGTDGLSTSFSTKNEILEYDLIAGDDMSGIFGAYAQLTGLSNPAPDSCASGAPLILDGNFRSTSESIVNIVSKAKSAGLHISEVWLGNTWHPQSDPYGFDWDRSRFPDPEQFSRALHEFGTLLCLSVNPYISENSPQYEDVLDAGYLLSDRNGNAVLCDTPSGSLGIIDIRNPQARSWFTIALDTIYKSGCDRFESDYCGAYSDIFADAVGEYGEDYMSSFAEILNSAVSDTIIRTKGRIGYFTIADSVSAGDRRTLFRNISPQCTPGFPALAATLRNAISYGMSGLTSVNIDVPDIATQDPLLFARWLQLAAFAPHFRLRCTNSIAGGDASSFSQLKMLADIRTGLAPYLYSTICEGIRYGIPAMRAMVVEFPADQAAASSENQYMLGSSLMVCPVLTRNNQISVYIPAGIWTDFMTREKIRGPKYLVKNVDSDTIPVFVRPNSILVTRSSDSHYETGILDGLTFTCFELAPGSVTACEVFGEDGNTSGIIRITTGNNRITVQTSGFGRNKRIVLSDIVNVVSVSESMPEQTQFGTMIEFSGNELIIGLG